MGLVESSTEYSNESITTRYGKLAYIKDDKLELEVNLEHVNINKYFIISMIGCARIGKSTYINAFLTFLLKRNVNIAKTSTSFQHCTTGIDYIYVPYEDITLIILDSQGLNYDDSKYDDKILTFLYSVSNIMVYHCNNIIDNQTLSALTSLCIVSNYIGDKMTVKPKLFFRIRDYSLEAKPEEFLHNTFLEKHDQYDGVRKAIKNLFPIIGAFHTESLNRATLRSLNGEKHYQGILDTDEYKFVSSFNILIGEFGECFNTFNYDKIPIIINNINTGTNLSCVDYDYYTLLVNAKFTEHWDSIDPYVHTPIVPSKYQIEIDKYNRIVSIVDNHYKTCLDQFASMDREVLIKKCDERRNALLAHNEETIKLNYNSALEFITKQLPEVNHNVIDYVNKIKLSINKDSNVSEIYGQVLKMIHHYINIRFDTINNLVVEQIKLQYDNFIKDAIDKMNANIVEMQNDYELAKQELTCLIDKYINGLIDEYVVNNILYYDCIKTVSTVFGELIVLIHHGAKNIFKSHTLHYNAYIICLTGEPLSVEPLSGEPFFDHKIINQSDTICNTFGNVFINCQYSDISTEYLPMLLSQIDKMKEVFNNSYKVAIDNLAQNGHNFSFDELLIYDTGKCLTEFAILEVNNISEDLNNTNYKLFDAFNMNASWEHSEKRIVYSSTCRSNETCLEDKVDVCTDTSYDKWYIITTHNVLLEILLKMCNSINYNHTYIADCFKRRNINFRNVICASYVIDDNIDNTMFVNKILSALLDEKYLMK